MKKSNTKNFPSLSQGQEVIVQGIAAKLGEEISRLFVASLRDVLLFMQEKNTSLTDPHVQTADEFLTAAELAKILKISRALAYQLMKTKIIPSFSVGKTVRVRRKDLDAFVHEHMVY